MTEEFIRVDLRIPKSLYDQVYYIAKCTNQEYSPRSKNTANPQRSVTQIILFLIKKAIKDYELQELINLINSEQLNQIDNLDKIIEEKLKNILAQMLNSNAI